MNATASKTAPADLVAQISPKGDVWSLGCILYCMTYGKTPFQSITNQISKLHAIIDPSHKIEFPDISEKDLLDVLKVKEKDGTKMKLNYYSFGLVWISFELAVKNYSLFHK